MQYFFLFFLFIGIFSIIKGIYNNKKQMEVSACYDIYDACLYMT